MRPKTGKVGDRVRSVQPRATSPRRGFTREAYALDVRQLTAWCGQHDRRLFDARRVDIEYFARDLEDRGRARATVARRLAGDVNSSSMPRPQRALRHPRRRRDLIARDHALVSLLALNGLRVSAAVSADIDALGVERGKIAPHRASKGRQGRAPCRWRDASPGRSTNTQRDRSPM